MSGVTDGLLKMAHELSPNPSERELDVLVSTGEQQSIALVTMALQDQGVEAASITGRQAAEWGWVVKSFPPGELDAEVARELHVLRNIDPSILAANKMAVNQAYEVMGIRTHVEQSWVWHHLSNLARARTRLPAPPDAARAAGGKTAPMRDIAAGESCRNHARADPGEE